MKQDADATDGGSEADGLTSPTPFGGPRQDLLVRDLVKASPILSH